MRIFTIALFAGWSVVFLLTGCSGDLDRIDWDAVRADKDTAVTTGDTDETLTDDIQNDKGTEDADDAGSDAPPPDADIPGGPDGDGYRPDDEDPDENESDGAWPDDAITDDGSSDGDNPDADALDDTDLDETVPDSDLPDDAQPDDATPDIDNAVPICAPNEIVDCPYAGDPEKLGVGPCKAATKQCSPDGYQWGLCTGEVLPQPDVCTDSIDNDCNGTMNDGYPDNAAGCLCVPKSTDSCYTGPTDTLDVGICHAGTMTCNLLGTGYGACQNEQTPLLEEICDNGDDDDCDGPADEDMDEDGDGWGRCSGDCCENLTQCADPVKVNPGAVEVQGDGIDNDCNDQTDESPPTDCSTAAKFAETTPLDLLYAMDICYMSTNGSWGIVGTPTLTRAGATGTVDNRQIAVMTQFGTHDSNFAIANDTMATLSSGRARDGNDPDATTALTYSYVTGTPPADFISAHDNILPTTKTGCPSGSGANDSVMLTVQLKVPTNALSLSFDFRFFSQEYWEYTCSEYNDFFIAMLDTGAEGIPADKNISFDSNGGYISVNTDQFFTVCEVKEGYTCPDGTDPLAGTGYDQQEEDTGGCTPGYHYYAGATQWLTTSAPVVPGETITLRFVIWDTSDQSYDSLVLLDNFKWSAEGTSGPVTFACWDTNKNGECDVETEDLSGDEKCSEFDCL